jgi:glycerol-3-phosphate acyltransferase PlsX
MGGDLGPSEAVAAAALAFKEGVIGPADTLILVGHEDNLRLLAREHRILNKPDRVFYRHAPTAVSMDDAAMTVLKSKRDSSMVKALEMLKAGEADVVVSTGNTKALVAAGTIKVRPMEGAERPALAAIMPRREGHFIMLDVGANPEAKPEHLLHNAVLGSIYAQCSLGIANPRVGLLTVGTEEGKGGARINRTHQLLKAMGDRINYVGPVEGYDVFGDACDVVVTDGFTGNVLVKTIEGLVYMVRDLVGSKVKRNPVYIASGVAMFPLLRDLKGKLKPERYGGAPLLGLTGLVMKAHGSSNRQGICSAIRLGLEALGHDAGRRMQAALAEANQVVAATPEEA